MASKASAARPRVAFIDIETAPTLAWVWKRFKENIGQSQVRAEGYVLCVAWKWLGEDTVQSAAIPDARSLRSDNDSSVVRRAWNVLDKADIVVAHNAKAFDLPTLWARFVAMGLKPPRPYNVIDTLEVVKRKFRFPSNKLDSIAQYLGLGAKEPHEFELWRGCMSGDSDAWERMVSYCRNDVSLLENVYQKILPWMEGTPNIGLLINDGRPRCVKCGGAHLQRRGYAYTRTQRYRVFRCVDCGGQSRSRFTDIDKDERHTILTHAVN